jgi:hypothetical protein
VGQVEVLRFIETMRERDFDVSIAKESVYGERLPSPTTLRVPRRDSLIRCIEASGVKPSEVASLWVSPSGAGAYEPATTYIANQSMKAAALRTVHLTRVEHSFTHAIARTITHPSVDGMLVVTSPQPPKMDGP